MMFGKPQWFRPKRLGWGLTPVTWQGWLYTLAWVAAAAVPFVILVLRNQPLEAIIWMTIAIVAVTYDVWQVMKAMKGPGPDGRGASSRGSADDQNDKVLYIPDRGPAETIATRNFKLQARG